MKGLVNKRFFIYLAMGLAITSLSAESGRDISFGLHFLAGGRYDNVRMCVGSEEGIKGGPIMEIYGDFRVPLGKRDYLSFNLPLMRPVLFASAFQMLQFEPQITYEHHFGPKEKPHYVAGAGLGSAFHYGPDYKSSPDNRGEDFFAWGPLISGFFGKEIPGKRNSWMPGIKVFSSPLFSGEYHTGIVAGAALELHLLY